jgi:hypothetical protein
MVEVEPGIYPSRDEIRIIKYNDKINFYSHYILYLDVEEDILELESAYFFLKNASILFGLPMM